MKRFTISSAVAMLALALAGCPEEEEPTPDAGADAGPGFTQPAGTIPVNFGPVDDTANKLFKPGELMWKGAMSYNKTTRVIEVDSSWGCPGTVPPPASGCCSVAAGECDWTLLYDDGPWNIGHTGGGHEPIGSVAGDNKWGVTVFVTPPATGQTQLEYGLIDVVYETNFGNGWIWPPPNGQLTIPAGATAAINAPGMTIAPHGTTDLRIVVDTANLAPPPAGGNWDTTTVKIKGSAWAWSTVDMFDNGQKGDEAAADGKWTFLLSEIVGTGKQFSHSGLLKSGDKAQFVIVFSGPGNGEYRADVGGSVIPATQGVTAGVKPAGATTWTAATVENMPSGDRNAVVTVP